MRSKLPEPIRTYEEVINGQTVTIRVFPEHVPPEFGPTVFGTQRIIEKAKHVLSKMED